jgi:hypothetical protein
VTLDQFVRGAQSRDPAAEDDDFVPHAYSKSNRCTAVSSLIRNMNFS